MSDARPRFLPRTDVTLARLDPSHAEAMFRWVSNPEVAQSIGLRSTPSLKKTQEWIARANADSQFQAHAILLDGNHVGNVVLDRIDSWAQSARLSIYIGETSARSQGIGSSAVYRAADVFFEFDSHNKIWLTVHAENSAAIQSYRKVGFQIEGTLREEFNLNGRLVDALYMGLLRSDFKRAQA